MDPTSQGQSTLLIAARPSMRKRSDREVRLPSPSEPESDALSEAKSRTALTTPSGDKNWELREQFNATVRDWGQPRTVELRIGESKHRSTRDSPRSHRRTSASNAIPARVIEFLDKVPQTSLHAGHRRPCRRLSRGIARWIDVYVDFTQIRTISTAAALVLAAEFYTARRYRRVGISSPCRLGRSSTIGTMRRG